MLCHTHTHIHTHTVRVWLPCKCDTLRKNKQQLEIRNTGVRVMAKPAQTSNLTPHTGM